ncbi:2'-5' RNA ligase family protein [Hymenobacter rigui]|uniref:2'-5' RNA ligase family protein n=1 Tax=Hymenobacter rigui TaxID=334424 RepID=A0A428KC33_9BACT|nr:2'-5' RNA ligase family protein [Hymenobacter rigui]RSK43983.1 2'-5' RNA ligase family protein [Hymenobacter rigui]
MELFLVVLLLPEPANQQVWALKQEVHKLTGSRNALRLPPHITLIPPFRQPAAVGQALELLLQDFAARQLCCTAVLQNFAWFESRTLYVPVIQAAGLHALHADLYAQCSRHLPEVPAPTRPFVPHVTLATRDLPSDQVPALRAQFATRAYAAQVTLRELAMYRHNGQLWQQVARFELTAQ